MPGRYGCSRASASAPGFIGHLLGAGDQEGVEGTCAVDRLEDRGVDSIVGERS